MLKLDNPYIGRIIDEFSVFDRLKGLSYQKATVSTNNFNTISLEMLNKKIITIDQKDAFEILYKKFQEEQDDNLRIYQETGQYHATINTLIKNIRADGEKFASIHAGKSNTEKKITSADRVSLLSKIFSLWSITASYS